MSDLISGLEYFPEGSIERRAAARIRELEAERDAIETATMGRCADVIKELGLSKPGQDRAWNWALDEAIAAIRDLAKPPESK